MVVFTGITIGSEDGKPSFCRNCSQQTKNHHAGENPRKLSSFMFYICPGHVPDISQTCPKCVQTYPRHVPDMSRHVLAVSQIHPGHVQTSPTYVLYMSWTRPDISQTCPKYVQTYPRHVPDMS